MFLYLNPFIETASTAYQKRLVSASSTLSTYVHGGPPEPLERPRNNPFGFNTRDVSMHEGGERPWHNVRHGFGE
jgi:hypothetical protein